ncbi:hypothetical protein Q4519_20285 [Motilimonas sp. 1_MG-2023]|uniref:hypothetical protein n=1 Tax=Motilimonas sp. 1_MG-2023 TaxID=3062672 RepID=UPI0026E35845|nr:hypothetical protein [Motilimonas sp. 1_MG-2023]MDO6528017.1 hypothetical protein [Motilimonas sp. 1_MG-2023]
MKCFKVKPLALAFTSIATLVFSHASFAENTEGEKYKTIKVNCQKSPLALQKALAKKHNKSLKLVIAGTCSGPIEINRTGKTILQSSSREKAVITMTDDLNSPYAITVNSSNVTLANLHFNLPNHNRMLSINHNGVVHAERLTSGFHQGDTQQKPHIHLLGNSSLIAEYLQGVDIRVRGNSYAQFDKGNQLLSLIISDTSATLAKNASEFEQIQVWGNGHLESNDGVSISNLALYGQSSAEVLNSQVDTLTLGGRTMFAAYENSTVTGPYSFYTNNYIFEIVSSSLNNWTSQSHPNALISGFNATVNGTTYPDWSWSGEDGSLNNH